MTEPLSLEESMSRENINLMEHSWPSIFDAERNFGLLFKNHYLDKRMTASAGFFAVTGGEGEFFSQHYDFDLSGHISGLPVYSKEKSQLVHLGLSLIKVTPNRPFNPATGVFMYRFEGI